MDTGSSASGWRTNPLPHAAQQQSAPGLAGGPPPRCVRLGSDVCATPYFRPQENRQEHRPVPPSGPPRRQVLPGGAQSASERLTTQRRKSSGGSGTFMGDQRHVFLLQRTEGPTGRKAIGHRLRSARESGSESPNNEARKLLNRNVGWSQGTIRSLPTPDFRP